MSYRRGYPFFLSKTTKHCPRAKRLKSEQILPKVPMLQIPLHGMHSRTKAPAIKDHEWERVRQVFIDMYTVQNLTLPEIRQQLSGDPYYFDAKYVCKRFVAPVILPIFLVIRQEYVQYLGNLPMLTRYSERQYNE